MDLLESLLKAAEAIKKLAAAMKNTKKNHKAAKAKDFIINDN